MSAFDAMAGKQAAVAYIALGSNLGDRRKAIRSALTELRELPGVEALRVSSIIETPPEGPAGQSDYLNAAAELRTTLSPQALLEAMLAIERRHGRNRAKEQRCGPRTLDLDLLLHGDRVIQDDGLVVPHPRMHERLFVLQPLAEIAPRAFHPLLGQTVDRLLEHALQARRRPGPAQDISPCS